MEFDKLTEAELREFLEFYPNIQTNPNLSLIQRARQLYEILRLNPSSRYPDFIIDLARAQYLKKMYEPYLQMQPPYTSEQISNMTYDDLRRFIELFGLPLESLQDPVQSFQQVQRILYFLGLIQTIAPKDVFLQTPILNEICKNLTFEEANIFRIAQGVSSLNCSVQINDSDQQIFQLFPINSQTNEIYLHILKSGSISSFMQFAEANRLDLIKMLIQNGLNINIRDLKQSSQTILIIAAKNGYQDLLDYLLANGADVNITNFEGWNALMMTSAESHRENILKSLIQAGSDVNRVTENGWSALIIAVIFKNFENIKFLVEHGADANKSNAGAFALILAVRNGRLEIVEFLLKQGIDIDVQNPDGETALMAAIRNQNLDLVELLLKYKPNLNITNQLNQTAFDIANVMGNEEIKELIQKSIQSA